MNKLLTIISILVFTPFSLFAQTDTTLYSTYSEYELDTTLYSDSSEPGYYEEDSYEDPTENSLGGTVYSEITKIVNTETLNIREGMGTQYGIIGQVKSGDVVRVEEENGKWSLIETGDGIRGYVANRFLYENYDNLPVGSYQPNDNSVTEDDDIPFGLYITIFFIGVALLKGLSKFSSGNSTSNNKVTSTVANRENNNPKPNINHYGCSKCGKFIKSPTQPSSQGCSVATFHSWNRLGKVGSLIYGCSKCSGVLYSDSQPASSGCSVATFHSWNRLGDYGNKTYCCSKCGIDVSSKSQPSSQGCSSGTFHSWSKL